MSEQRRLFFEVPFSCSVILASHVSGLIMKDPGCSPVLLPSLAPRTEMRFCSALRQAALESRVQSAGSVWRPSSALIIRPNRRRRHKRSGGRVEFLALRKVRALIDALNGRAHGHRDIGPARTGGKRGTVGIDRHPAARTPVRSIGPRSTRLPALPRKASGRPFLGRRGAILAPWGVCVRPAPAGRIHGGPGSTDDHPKTHPPPGAANARSTRVADIIMVFRRQKPFSAGKIAGIRAVHTSDPEPKSVARPGGMDGHRANLCEDRMPRPKGKKNNPNHPRLPFKQSEIERAIRAVKAMGLRVGKIEVEPLSGKITITPGAPSDATAL
jgi:hypothetical protein